jgi:hypothetical protein
MMPLLLIHSYGEALPLIEEEIAINQKESKEIRIFS